MNRTAFISFEQLLREFKAARIKPFQNISKWLVLQEKLLIRLTSIESRIRKNRAVIKGNKAQLGNASNLIEKQAAIQLKKRIKKCKEKIDELEKLYGLYKSIGDGIAFTFIDRFDLKPQYFKQPPGFISKKKGTRFERQCLRTFFKQNIIALMNDLTHTMKYGDLTIITGYDTWRLIECKSSTHQNSRSIRQAVQNEKLTDYLFNDLPVDLYNIGHPMTRREAVTKWKTNENIIEQIIDEAVAKGSCLRKLKKGYVIASEYGDHSIDLKKVITGLKFRQPLVVFQNSEENKYHNTGLVPYCITFNNPRHYLDFLKGNIRIFHLMDMNLIEDLSSKHGFNLKVLNGNDYIFEFVKINNPDASVRISQHYFSRVFLEFVDVSSIINDTLQSFNQDLPKFIQSEKIPD